MAEENPKPLEVQDNASQPQSASGEQQGKPSKPDQPLPAGAKGIEGIPPSLQPTQNDLTQTPEGGGGLPPPLTTPPVEPLDLVAGGGIKSDVPAGGGAPPPPPMGPPKTIDEYRATIALWLLAILTGVVLFSLFFFWYYHGKDDVANLKELLDVLFAPITALVGTATGYYFGAASNQSLGK